MTASDIKLDLFRKLDSLSGEQLEQAYGMLINFINNQKSNEDWWNNLSPEQKNGIERGLSDIDNGILIAHEEVAKKYGL